MLKIEMVLKSFASGLLWRKYPHAPTWLSKTQLFHSLASRQPVPLPGGFMLCSTLCKGLGETSQFAAFHGLLHVWNGFSRSESCTSKGILKPCVWGLWSRFHSWCWARYCSESCSCKTLRKKPRVKLLNSWYFPALAVGWISLDTDNMQPNLNSVPSHELSFTSWEWDPIQGIAQLVCNGPSLQVVSLFLAPVELHDNPKKSLR